MTFPRLAFALSLLAAPAFAAEPHALIAALLAAPRAEAAAANWTEGEVAAVIHALRRDPAARAQAESAGRDPDELIRAIRRARPDPGAESMGGN